MRLVTEYFQPSELTDLARDIQADTERPRDTDYKMQRLYLPSTFEHDVDYRVRAGQKGIPTSAKFRAFDSEAPVGHRPGFTEVSGSLLPLGERHLVTEADRLKLRRNPGEAFRRELAECAQAATLATVVRMERAILSTFITGMTTLTNERGVTQQANWGRNPNRTITATTLWTDPATSKPLTTLSDAAEVYDSEGTMVMSTPTFRMMARSEQLRGLAGVSSVGTPEVISQDFVRNVLSAQGLPDIDLYDAKFINDAGVEERILPTGYVLFLPSPGSSAAGQTVWGITAEAMEPAYDIEETDYPGIVVGHYKNDHPVQDWVNAAAVGFPVLAGPDRTMSVKVS